ncbi:DNA methyltransferase [Xanthomonas campestris]|uniref:DNA methyltransferase n=1 Tax=Xanthomonas campestris pv. papavericola TaxID=487881 RepID=A0AAJ2X1K8_XANCA|nr:DNA methyltransferase [Xanthomonas campestris]MEC3887094.1 DNA methyltransferase [Xanthomonas campestris pv. papavericola]
MLWRGAEKVRGVQKHHMAGKPVGLMRQVARICEAGGRILDPFAGSGTTLVEAQMEGFAWTGCEVTEHYAKVARERVAAL